MPSTWSLRYSIWGKLYTQCMLNAALCYAIVGCIYWVSYRNTASGIMSDSGFDLAHVFLVVVVSIMIFTLFLFSVFTVMLWVQSDRYRSALIGCSAIPIYFGIFGVYSVLSWVYTDHVLWIDRLIDVYQNTVFK